MNVVEVHYIKGDMDHEPSVSSVNPLETRYRRLFETAQDGILILDGNTGVIQDANFFIINLLGYSKDELIGKELWEIGPFLDKSAALHAFTVLKDKGYIRYEDLPLRSKAGDVVNVEFVSNVYGVNGELVIQCNIRDISDRKQLENELLKYQHSVSISMREMVKTLSNVVVARDSYTGSHMRRVANLATAICTEMNLPLHTIEGVNMASLVHDIGKISVPAEILTKPTPLVDYEIQMLKQHPQTGYDILKHIHFPWNIAQAILQHHERLDGSGYPNSLKGDVICLEARVIAVADTMEAMSFDRPYRKGKGIAATLEEISRGSGRIYDAEVAQACLKLFKNDDYIFPEHVYSINGYSD
jgi:PAS domain S-box-containing protein/putative nucleotidyltransferase with HDIG domain